MLIKKLLLIAILLLPTSLWAANPVVLFSDLQDAPTTGWEQSATKGAAVTIWCRNVGTTRGTSYVTVGGVNLTNAADYAEWGATTTPTVPLGMQRITFYLNSSMTTSGTYPNTTISVTTSEGTSPTIPFHTRALSTNKIYFIDIVNGDNTTNNGLYATDSGTNGPKKTPGWARGNLLAGDIAYVIDQGTAYSDTNSEDDDTGFYGYCSQGLLTMCQTGVGTINYHQGTEGNSIGFIAYPGHSPRMEPLDETNTGAIAWVRTVSAVLNYWTFAKFTVNGLRSVDTKEIDLHDKTGGMNNIRFIGSSWTTPAVTVYDFGDCLDLNGGLEGVNNLYILGNYFHNLASDGDHVPYDGEPPFKSYAIYYNGYGAFVDTEIGWNEVDWVPTGRAFQIYMHEPEDYVENLKIHDNYIHGTLRQGIALGGEGSPTGYRAMRGIYIYNNIVTIDYTENALQLGTNTGGYYGSYYVYNNVFQVTAPDYPPMFIQDTTEQLTIKNNIIIANGHSTWDYYTGNLGPNSEPPLANIDASNNIYYGAGAGNAPTWDESTLTNNDPLFVDSTPDSYTDYMLQSDSPAKGAGVTNTYATRDFVGLSRGTTFDIGAYEYAEGGDPPTVSGVMIRTGSLSIGAGSTPITVQ